MESAFSFDNIQTHKASRLISSFIRSVIYDEQYVLHNRRIQFRKGSTGNIRT
jgi:hypothetical protein